MRTLQHLINEYQLHIGDSMMELNDPEHLQFKICVEISEYELKDCEDILQILTTVKSNLIQLSAENIKFREALTAIATSYPVTDEGETLAAMAKEAL